jgi:ParB/RepB/Spo0J family partition protein
MATAEPKTRLKEIKLTDIHENPVALRSVNRQLESFQGLVDSIREKGVLNAILVRELKNEETGETYYGLIDGLQRFSASQDAGRETIPAKVVSMSDAEVWRLRSSRTSTASRPSRSSTASSSSASCRATRR